MASSPSPIPHSPFPIRPLRAAFTLIELLVVIAIIALLAALLLPSLNNARRVAKGVHCKNNLKNLYLGCRLYMDDYNEIMVGWMGPWSTAPQPGQTTWYLEARRYMNTLPAGFKDSRDIWNDPEGWIKEVRLQLCPEDLKWGPYEPYGSYGMDIQCWQYYLEYDGGSIYYPTFTQRYALRSVRKPDQSVFTSEILHHAGFQVMDSTTQTANVWDPAYAAGGWLSARHYHPGKARVPDTSNQYFWEGMNNYAFFDGHVEGRSYPPYSYGSTLWIPKGSNLQTYANFVQ